MKKIILAFLVINCFHYLQAQKELWGNNKTQSYIDYTNPANPITYPYFGNITKYDINGDTGTVVHVFDGINGKLPTGKLFLASNGMLYGITSSYTSSTGIYSAAFLFEYNLILNKYRNVHTFYDIFNLPQDMESGVIEGATGKLYGAIGIYFFCYDISTETTTMHLLNNYNAWLTGDLIKASDNNLYGCVYQSYSCPTSNSVGAYKGIIVKINPINNSSEVKYIFNCDAADGTYPIGGLIESTAGKLLGNTYYGGDLSDSIGAGTIFEYNIITNTFTNKVIFNGENNGGSPQSLASTINGKFYGVCRFGGSTIIPPNNFINYLGSLFEYTPSTNVINKLLSFPNDAPVVHPTSIMRASTGLFFGVSESGVFRYNSIDNTLVLPDFNQPAVTEPLIEICRKPSYQEIVVSTYTPEVGSTFTYNIQNTNATTYVWKKGTTILPLQTTAILNLTNVTTNDTGVYTCTMTNECGTTVTANLNINVSNLGTDTIDNYKQQITLYPNPTKGSINLKFPENRGLKATSYKITNMLGQTIQKQEIAKINSKNELTIDTAGFVKGVYQLTLTTDKGDWNGKFVKE